MKSYVTHLSCCLMFVLVGLVAGVARAEVVDLDAGLIAHYSFDGTSGPVIDATGNHNGTNYGATRGVTGKFGNAFQFDGVNDYVDTLLPGDIPAVSTVSVWVKAGDTTRTNQIYGSIDTTNGGKDGFAGEYYGPDLRAMMTYFSSNITRGRLDGPSNSFQSDTWTHFAFSVDSLNQMKIYVNGILNVSGSLSVSPTSHDRALMFGKGAFSGGGSHPLLGALDEIRIYDRALSAAEVQALAVPEPATMSLLALGGLAVLRRRKK